MNVPCPLSSYGFGNSCMKSFQLMIFPVRFIGLNPFGKKVLFESIPESKTAVEQFEFPVYPFRLQVLFIALD
ncbi:hypothetical protein ES703_103672 [subsurface metagenome]